MGDPITPRLEPMPASPSIIHDVTGVILAGGLGTRMGGCDKGLQLYGGKPLAAHVAERLRPQVDTLLINANRNAADYAHLGYRVIADAITGFVGPLAGLHSALSLATTPFVVTAPCDSPQLPHDLVQRLHAHLIHADAPLAIARAGGRIHPVFCLCRRELHEQLNRYLLDGGRKVAYWCANMGGIEVDFDDCADAFANFNTLADLSSS